MHGKTRFALAGLAAVATLGIAPAAHAQSGNDDIIRTGNCSGGSDWQLKVGTDDGQLDGEFEVDSNVVGQTWNVRILDNSTPVFSGSEVTVAPSGSFEIDFRTPPQDGPDKSKPKAGTPGTGRPAKPPSPSGPHPSSPPQPPTVGRAPFQLV